MMHLSTHQATWVLAVPWSREVDPNEVLFTLTDRGAGRRQLRPEKLFAGTIAAVLFKSGQTGEDPDPMQSSSSTFPVAQTL